MSNAIEWEDVRPYSASWNARAIAPANAADVIQAVLDGQAVRAGLPSAAVAELRPILRKSGTDR